MKQTIIAILIIAGIIGGAILISKDKNKDQPTGDAAISHHVSGGADAKVKIVEFADFECPYCGQMYPIVEQVRNKYGDKISYQFYNFPIVNIHRNSLAAHRSAEAASNQGKFWEMYGLIFSNQEAWNGPSTSDPNGATTEQAIATFKTYAQQLGLDMNKFNQDFEGTAVLNTINADTNYGKTKYNITGTPYFLINGENVDVSKLNTLDSFSAIIDEKLK